MAEFGYRRVEADRIPGRDRVGDGPVYGGLVAQFLVVTVCDLAREELGHQAVVHWSVPDPVPVGDPISFDAAVAELSHRVERLAPRLAPTS